jgi:hypothetical protein
MKGEDGKLDLFSNKSLLSLLSRSGSKSHERSHQSKGTPPSNQDRLLRKKQLEMENMNLRTTSRSSSQTSLNSGHRAKEPLVVERISNGVNIYVSNINVIMSNRLHDTFPFFTNLGCSIT